MNELAERFWSRNTPRSLESLTYYSSNAASCWQEREAGRPRRLMALLLVVSHAMGAASSNADCPCIDVRPKLPLTDEGCLAPTCNSPLEPGNMDTAGMCITGDYGSSSCAMWDLETNYLCNVTTPPSYCSEPWCYVDSAACRLSTKRFELSRYFPEVSDLFFSYATCGGDRSDFANHQRLDTVSGRPLTFVIPSVACTPLPFPTTEAAPWHQANLRPRLWPYPRPCRTQTRHTTTRPTAATGTR